jgi:ribosomal protein S21
MDEDNNAEYASKLRGMTVKVYNNDIERAISTLKRRMNTEGINKELRKRKHFVPGSLLRRQRLAEAKLRWKKKYAQIMDIDLPKKKRSKNDDRTPVSRDVIDIKKD